MSKARTAGFEQRMQKHLREFFAEHCRQIGNDGVLEMIKCGIERAAAYQITTERDVCKYIDLMFCFGRDYDQNPKLPWAASVLNSPLLASPGGRIDAVFDAALEYLRQNPDFHLAGQDRSGALP